MKTSDARQGEPRKKKRRAADTKEAGWHGVRRQDACATEKRRAADAKEVGVGNPAEETYCYPNGVIVGHPGPCCQHSTLALRSVEFGYYHAAGQQRKRRDAKSAEEDPSPPSSNWAFFDNWGATKVRDRSFWVTALARRRKAIVLQPPPLEVLGEFEPLLIIRRLDHVRVHPAFVCAFDVSGLVR